MKTIIFYTFSISLFTLLMQSCNLSDRTENLGHDYFYRNEGELIKDILCKNAKGGEVPATVIAYAFDDEFIVAKQKPKLPQDPLYHKEYLYKHGIDTIYFWLIVHKKNLVLGPLNEAEFAIIRKEHHVPDKLKLN